MHRTIQRPRRVSILALGMSLFLAPAASAQEEKAKKAADDANTAAEAAPADAVPAPEEAPLFDEVKLKDGSRILGEVVALDGDTLKVKTAFGVDDEVKVKWGEVASLKTAKPVTLLLDDGTKVIGRVDVEGGGDWDVRPEGEAPLTVEGAKVKAVNPPSSLQLKANLGFGGSVSRGNTETRTMSLLANAEFRLDRHRVTGRGIYNYADDESGVTAQYGLASLKYDFFLMDPSTPGDGFLPWFLKRTYLYVNGFLEHDGPQDLSLRAAATGGLGFQVIEKGDFEADWLKDMTFFVEGGAGYKRDDYKVAPDVDGTTARWAVQLDWPFLPDRLAFFHNHEGYPSIENSGELYINTETGLRVNIWGGLVATAQVNWRWNNAPPVAIPPAPAIKRGDTIYLLTIGYAFTY